MKLRAKLLSVFSAVIIVYAFFNYVIIDRTVLPGFVSLEREEAEKDVERCLEAIDSEIHHLDSLCHDWAAWNDTYEFVADKNNEYIATNLPEDVFLINSLNILYFYNSQGELSWGKSYDLDSEEYMSIPEFSPTLPKSHPLLSYKTNNMSLELISVKGIFQTEKGPLLISSRPIITSEHEGPIRGSIIMGRLLTDTYAERLQAQIKVYFEWWSYGDSSTPKEAMATLKRISKGAPIYIDEVGGDILNVYTKKNDLLGNTAILLKAEVPRDIFNAGKAVLNYTALSIMLSVMLLFLVLLILLDILVLKPVIELTNSVAKVADMQDISMRIPLKRKDELSKLTMAVNQMLHALENSVDAQRKMESNIQHAEKIKSLNVMAGNIAHNFNNLLHTVMGFLELAISELPKDSATRDSIEEASKAAKKAAELSIQMLTYVGQSGSLFIPINLSEMVESMEKSMNNLISEHIEKQCSLVRDLPQIQGDLSQLQQVLRILLSNSSEAIGENQGKITITTGDMECNQELLQKTYLYEGQSEGNYVYLEVKDTGIGMDKETGSKIFDPYFTTKFTGRGLGLASVLGIIRGHRGAITVNSKPDRGTTIRILFPVIQQ